MRDTTKMLEDNPYLDSYLDAPWAKAPKAYQNIVHEDENVIVYKDGFPVTEGHLLFVPKRKTRRMDITICFEYAWEWGVKGIMDYKWEAFNVGINNGVAAGQTVMWPHVHLIPRRKDDTPNPKGGVRNVIPLKGNYEEVEDTLVEAAAGQMFVGSPPEIRDALQQRLNDAAASQKEIENE
jgi:diadenosine tetraphosphate (Ap4A) HIT family hydrolase